MGVSAPQNPFVFLDKTRVGHFSEFFGKFRKNDFLQNDFLIFSKNAVHVYKKAGFGNAFFRKSEYFAKNRRKNHRFANSPRVRGFCRFWGAEIAHFAKVACRIELPALFAHFPNIAIKVDVFNVSREPRWRKSALFAKKCTFSLQWAPRAPELQNLNTYALF